VCRPRPASHR